MPAQVEIRHVEFDEIEAFHRSISTTFLQDAGDTARHLEVRGRGWEPQRAWGAWADGRFVGTLRTTEHQLSVPGLAEGTLDVPVDALTAVTVAATHHRQGLLRRMLSDSLQAAHDRGDALSILVAAEWAIYGRFGYWPAATWADRTLAPRRPGAKLRVPVTGRVRQVELAEARTIAPGVFDHVRRQRAGHIDRNDATWDRVFSPDWRAKDTAEPVAIVHEGTDGIDGVLLWHAKAEFGWVTGGKVAVDDLFANNQAAYTALWGYLLDLDVVDEVSLEGRPPDEPIALLLADGRSIQTTALIDAMWVRLLDVSAALSARAYATPGRLCFEVIDDDTGGYAAGRYLLDAGPDGAECKPDPGGTPQLQMSQRALAAIYLGQPSLRAQCDAGLVDELAPGAIAKTDAMFGTALLPWVGTGF